MEENKWGQRLKEVKERGTYCQLIHPQKSICELLESVSCMIGTKRIPKKCTFLTISFLRRMR